MERRALEELEHYWMHGLPRDKEELRSCNVPCLVPAACRTMPVSYPRGREVATRVLSSGIQTRDGSFDPREPSTLVRTVQIMREQRWYMTLRCLALRLSSVFPLAWFCFLVSHHS